MPHPYDRSSRRALVLICLLTAACERERASDDIAGREVAVAASPGPAVDPAAEAALAQVRRGYFNRDWWGCARDGQAASQRHATHPRLHAWTIVCIAGSGGDALALADAMLAAAPSEPWARFARAAALTYHPSRGEKEAVPEARAAVAALAEHPDARWLLGLALARHASSEAPAYLAAQRESATAEILALELDTLVRSSTAEEPAVLDLAAQIRRLDPQSVEAELLPAFWYLRMKSRPDDAMPLVRRALELAPDSLEAHETLWSAMLASQTTDVEQRRAAVDADITNFLKVRGDAPATLKAAAGVYAAFDPARRTALLADLLARFPTSTEAEWARFEDVMELVDERHRRREAKREDVAADALLLARIDAFVATAPRLHGLLGHVLWARHDLLSADEKTSNEVLLATLKQWSEYETINLHMVAEAAASLAEKGGDAVAAEQIVRAAIRRVEEQRAASGRPVDPNAASQPDYLLGAQRSALGGVLLVQGRREEAREALTAAAKQLPDSADLQVRLATLAEADGRVAEAEQLLVAGLTMFRGEESCDPALRALHRRQSGSDRGYDAYRARLERGVRDQRRAAVLAAGEREPKPLAPFVLPVLGGGELRSEALLGRVTVINFWGVSCSPCVRELPALQQLVEQFAKTPDVRVTTVNIDGDTSALGEWMTAGGHPFEVLLGARYYTDSGERAIPLTLFIDREGRVVYRVVGASDRLVEEFGWRIAALRERPRAAASG